MAEAKAFSRNRQVPAGSQVCAKVSGPAGTFNADGRLVSATAVVEWDQGDLVPGPVCAPLDEVCSTYWVEVRLSFLAQADVEIEIWIEKDGGSVHSSPHKWTVSGNNGDVAVRGDFIETECG